MNHVYILSGVRTAIGDFGGSLKEHSPAELGRLVIAEAIKRAAIAADEVGHVVLGQVIPSEPRDAYLARVAAVTAGIPVNVPALTLNRLCGSGLQAIITAAQGLALDDYDVAVAGGAESMSLAPHVLPQARWGGKMGDMHLLDAMTETLTDPFGNGHMGITAENVARVCEISRAEQDLLAATSHRRAARAIDKGHFASQILSIKTRSRHGARWFDKDEHVRPGVTLEELGALKPAFKQFGTVTAGNASGLNDGAAALVLASEKGLAGRTPRARILGWGHAGVAPELMGLGPIEAVPNALAKAGLSLDDMDVIEANEAFAAQACAVAKLLRFDPDKVNPNGSGIALGHPIGATGAILTVKALYELERIDGRYGLITMCIGGGQGIAMVIERV